ncbi:TonB-dependent siderophore receptor [Erwiniaceae bacterium BAC15a-03b]|uniref:TonB-dependent siderophore receptor n=1 Tax=Winslowiella arboricola TaxID=2978220 RepID=A0A9J6PNU9_9GAMM|nr:TonB-dependent siderophore receptor [Winslowiella arboricola]MCU5772568.1 TonB-dependent siderophore receptor [Winslowiella arboricola]MCU5779090.1 TonB-dependent siderophore receptor [Winslowiella arboricola]
MFKRLKKQQVLTADSARTRLILASALMVVPLAYAAAATEETLTVTASAQESVTSPLKGNVAKESASGTKTATPLRKTPQAISVITRQQMDDQAAPSVSDALSYTSGVMTNYRGNSNRNDEVISRGFRYAPKFLDGLSYGLSGQAGAAGQVDPWLLERVEMVHGPASVLYGQVNPGGLINMTSKRPTAESIHKVKFSSGNQHLAEAAFDFGGALNDDYSLFYRLNGIASTKHEFVKNEKQQRMAIAPALTWLPNEDTSITLLTSYTNEPEAGYRNFLPYAGTVVPVNGNTIPYDFNVSDSSYHEAKREQTSLGYIFEHNFNDGVSFTQNFRYSNMSESYKYLVYTSDVAGSPGVIGRRPQHDKIESEELGIDNQLKALFNTGEVTHSVLGGLDYKWSDVDTQMWLVRGDEYNLNWSNPTRISVDESSMSIATDTRKKLDQVGVYLQDQLEWHNWNLLLSGRHDWAEVRTLDRTSDTQSQQNDNKFTGRAGLLYAFANGVSPYISYSTSFEPNLSSGAPGSDPFKPTTGEQTEVGVKYQPPGSETVITVAAFDITQKNITQYNSVLGYNQQIGKVQSKGVETEIHSQLTPEINVMAAYTYTDAVTKESSIAGQAGNTPAIIPRHAASAWGSYSFHDGVLNGLTLGSGVRYTGVTWGDSVGGVTVPHYTLYDAMAKYELGEASSALKGTTLQFNVNNLTDKHYVSSCNNDSACFYGSGRTMVASVSYSW